MKTVRSTLRFSYEEPTAIRWVQEKGETKSLTGSWTFEDLGDGRTRATYALEADPGRMLGMLLRGPAETKVRDFLLGDAAEGLKQKAEAGADGGLHAREPEVGRQGHGARARDGGNRVALRAHESRARQLRRSATSG